MNGLIPPSPHLAAHVALSIDRRVMQVKLRTIPNRAKHMHADSVNMERPNQPNKPPYHSTLLLHIGKKEIEGVKVRMEEGFHVLSHALSLDVGHTLQHVGVVSCGNKHNPFLPSNEFLL
ncbi:unnamed protein product [Sphenostylis stenocarpa]|uniref:Uncharacterized protein n=1 Tax=Sphenostylis stenocarpa TaxID=92480 RepID=A0AA86RXF3_9FABA|nr:unnamed protein product [Sphenostylis stenocarpa]